MLNIFRLKIPFEFLKNVKKFTPSGFKNVLKYSLGLHCLHPQWIFSVVPELDRKPTEKSLPGRH